MTLKTGSPLSTEISMSHGPSQSILDNLTTAVLTFDGALRLTSINPAGEMLFEVSSKKWSANRSPVCSRTACAW